MRKKNAWGDSSILRPVTFFSQLLFLLLHARDYTSFDAGGRVLPLKSHLVKVFLLLELLKVVFIRHFLKMLFIALTIILRKRARVCCSPRKNHALLYVKSFPVRMFQRFKLSLRKLLASERGLHIIMRVG